MGRLLSATSAHERQLPLERQHGDEQAEGVVKWVVSVEGRGHRQIEREREQRPPDRIAYGRRIGTGMHWARPAGAGHA